jgi:filamentous hemagglutinin family protein
MPMKLRLFCILLIISLPSPAQITTDGTLGPALSLPGPDYQIGPNLGQQHGRNLFQSFQDFSLNRAESATFSGPNSVNNVISRVTGGKPSNLDGTIRSTIPNADMYFLNPYGIMFGPNARLDVQGSFHASTADYLRLGDGGRFDARNPSESLLTVAPIESFGFLSNSPANISTQSSKLILAPEQTLSLIGGDIHLNSDIPLVVDNSLFIPTVDAQSLLATEHGQVNLVSVASPGDVFVSENEVLVQGKGGQIELNDSLLEMSGYGGGAVFIRAARLLLDNSIIRSNTFGQVDGKDIHLQLTESAYLNGLDTEISVFTLSENNSGRISIEVPHLEITGALINTGSGLLGRAGDIEIHAKNLLLKRGAFIASGSDRFGRSGDIRLNIEETLSLTGISPGYRINHGLEFENVSSNIFTISRGSGHGGNIFIDSQNLNISAGFISTDNFGTGQGGNVTINAQQALLLDGGTITSSTYAGQAGDVNLNIAEINIAGYRQLLQSAIGIQWNYIRSTISTDSFGEASGGRINIQAKQITVTDHGKITAKASDNGNAGDIFVEANRLQVDNGQIATSANHSAGGEIHININELLSLRNSTVTTSVQGGIGDGGNISISHPQFTILNKGQIKAQADEGHGGDIHIVAEQFIVSPDSLVSASSRLGLDGELKINSPTVDLDAMLVVLPGGYVEQAQLKTCTTDDIENPSTFKMKLSRERKVPFQE